MRELTVDEIDRVQGGAFQFGCDFLNLSDIAAVGGSSFAIGGAWGAATFGTVAGATAGGTLFSAIAVPGAVGYQIGTAFNNAVGQCSADDGRRGGS